MDPSAGSQRNSQLLPPLTWTPTSLAHAALSALFVAVQLAVQLTGARPAISFFLVFALWT